MFLGYCRALILLPLLRCTCFRMYSRVLQDVRCIALCHLFQRSQDRKIPSGCFWILDPFLDGGCGTMRHNRAIQSGIMLSS